MENKKFEDRWEDANNKIDYPSDLSRIVKIVGSIVALSIFALIVYWTVGGDIPSSQSTQTAQNTPPPPTSPTVPSAPTSQATLTAEPVALPKLNEKTAVGDFDITILGYAIDTKIENKTTENQYVMVAIALVNEDDRARDISRTMFKLVDEKGRKYDTSDMWLMDDSVLVYETLNPGLEKTFAIIFETARGLDGFKLEANSGVGLAGGTRVTFDLVE